MIDHLLSCVVVAAAAAAVAFGRKQNLLESELGI
jgi:hypothetical protein